MPHYRCSSCQTRHRLPEVAPHEVGHLCPHCGSLLDPVSEISRLIGCPAADPARSTASPGHEAVIVRIEELLARRSLIHERRRRYAEAYGLLDGGPGDPPAAASAAIALPTR